IEGFRPGIAELDQAIEGLISEGGRKSLVERIERLTKDGVPEELAHRVGRLDFLAPGLDIVRMAQSANRPVAEVGACYFPAGRRFARAGRGGASWGANPDTNGERSAVAAIVEDLYGHQRDLADSVMRQANGGGIDDWVERPPQPVQRIEALIADLRQQGGL